MCDGSGLYYAAKSCMDENGRRLLWGWIREGRPEDEQVQAGWSGVLSLPRVVQLGSDGTPRFVPAPELVGLRQQEFPVQTVEIGSSGGEIVVPKITGDCLELRVEFSPSNATRYGISVRRSPDGSEKLDIVYDRERGLLGEAPLRLTESEPLTLHIFVDRSVIEVFANGGRACHTYRTYPHRADAIGVSMFADSTTSAQVQARTLGNS
jgi:beta-fructofuranosidase